ncbi:hypothetical protein GCM10027592_61930 [Spirosoma flavus]
MDIACGFNHTYRIKYRLPVDEQPWENAEVLGEVTDFDLARANFITSMIKCGGWPNNDDLEQLCKSLNLFKQ